MPIIGETIMSAAELDGLRDPFVGRDIDPAQPLVQCVNCDTVYFTRSFDSLAQAHGSPCLNCRSDKYRRVIVQAGRTRPDRWGKSQKGGATVGKSTSKGGPKAGLGLSVALPPQNERLAPPAEGETWELVGGDKATQEVIALRKSLKGHHDHSSNSVAKWGGAYRTTEQNLFFSVGPDVFKRHSLGYVSKIGTARSYRLSALFQPQLLADFDIDIHGTCHIASTAFLRSAGGDIRTDPNIKWGSLRKEANVIGCRGDVPRLAQFYESKDKSGDTVYFLYTTVISAKQLLNAFPHLKGHGGATTRIFGGYMQDCRLKWSPSGDHLLIDHENLMGNLRVAPIHPDGSTIEAQIKVLKDTNVGCYYKAAWHPTQDVLAVGYTLRGAQPDVGFYVLDFRDGRGGKRLLEKRTEQSNMISAIDWSPDGRRIAVASKDATIFLYDTKDDDSRTLYTRGGSTGVHFSPDARRFAVSEDGQVSIWSTEGGERVASFIGGGWGGLLKGTPWTRGGREILVNSRDMSVHRLW